MLPKFNGMKFVGYDIDFGVQRTVIGAPQATVYGAPAEAELQRLQPII